MASSPSVPTPWMTRRELAQYVRVSYLSLVNLGKQGRLPPEYRILHQYLYNRDEVDEWIRNGLVDRIPDNDTDNDDDDGEEPPKAGGQPGKPVMA